MKKYLVLMLALCLCVFPFIARAEWSLSFKDKPVSAEKLDPFAGVSALKTPSTQKAVFRYSGQAHPFFYFSFLSAPDQLEVYAVQNGEKQLLKSLEECKDNFVLDLSDCEADTLEFWCLNDKSRSIELDAFLPLPSAEAAEAYAPLQIPDTCDTVILLSSMEVAETHADEIRQLLSRGSVGVAVIEKANPAEQNSTNLKLKRLGVTNQPEYLQCKGNKKGFKKAEQQWKSWRSSGIENELGRFLRHYRPLTVYTVADNAVANEAAELALQNCSLLAADPAWDKDSASAYGLWALPAINAEADTTREEAAQQNRLTVLAQLKDSFHSSVGEAEIPEWNPDNCVEELVIADAKKGVWVYQSTDCCITITRHTSAVPKTNLIWFEADIQVNPASAQRLEVVSIAEGKSADLNLQPRVIARTLKKVFAMTADYYRFREANEVSTGLIIRNGNVVMTGTETREHASFPPLSNLALLDNGGMLVGEKNEYSPEQLLDMGAYDVLSFGPVLVRDGNLCFPRGTNTDAREPRCALGLIEPWHYLAVVVEGRLKYSDGCTIQTLANLMYSRGAVQAFNLDGGASAVMFFMGEQISDVGNYSSGKPSLPRRTYEVLGIGYSDAVPEP